MRMRKFFKEQWNYIVENSGFLSLVLFCALGVCLIALFFHIFTGKEIPGQIMGAIFGVLFTAVVTCILLQGQTNQEKTLQRNAKIFEEKLKVYQTFLGKLYDAVKDGSLTDDEKKELQYQTALVAMLCKPENIKNVSEAVNEVVNSVCPQENSASVGETDLLKGLFSIVDALRNDLEYSDVRFSDTIKEETIKNFNAAFHVKTDSDDIGGDLAPAEAESGVSIWESALTRWDNSGWSMQINDNWSGERCFVMKSRTNGNPGVISLGFYKEHYYIQASYGQDSDFSKALKWSNGGYRSYGSWWKFLPAQYDDIKEGNLGQALGQDPGLQKFIVDRIEYLQNVIQANHRTTLWKKAVDEALASQGNAGAAALNHWTTRIWYWKTLVCESTGDDEGNLYFDILPSDDQHVVFKFSNRDKNPDLLKKTLVRIEMKDKIGGMKDCIADICTSSNDANDVAAKLSETLKKIQG